MATEVSMWGQPYGGQRLRAWRLGDKNGVNALISNYGGNIHELWVPAAARAWNAIVGHKQLDEYLAPGSLRSAIVGRFANRIAGGRFRLDGREIRLELNDPPNAIHGGKCGFDRIVWDGEPDGPDLVLRHCSSHGSQGFPGALHVEVRYSIKGDGLSIRYSATADAPTVVNLTNHAYFKLSAAEDITDHFLTIRADEFLPVDRHQIPLGELRSVSGTPFDFRVPTRIGERIGIADAQLEIGGGYDHTFVVGCASNLEPVLAAELQTHALSMQVHTTEPGLQFYSGNRLKAPFKRHGAICLEPQHFPDSPNRPEFPTTILRPGERFASETIYSFQDV